MEINTCIKETFSVIAKEGSTKDGDGFIQRLWEDNFSKGLYLAGVEVIDDANPPKGWVKWTIPSYEYMFTKMENKNTFSEVINYLNQNNIRLVGAVQEFNCPEDGHVYLFFPIMKL